MWVVEHEGRAHVLSEAYERRQRSLRASLGAHSLHAKYDSSELTKAARSAAHHNLNQRLLAEVYPDGRLPESERARRLEHARSAHFKRLALASAKKRRRRGAKR
jgi:hypothetical protein